MMTPRALTGLLLASALVAGCASGVESRRSIAVGGDVFGYHQYQGGWSHFEPDTFGGLNGIGYRPPQVITIMTRNGAPVTEADREAAGLAAQQLCHEMRRQWHAPARGNFLPGGGLSFPGACG